MERMSLAEMRCKAASWYSKQMLEVLFINTWMSKFGPVESFEPHGLRSPGIALWVWVVWSGCTGAGLKKTGLWSASGCGGCFFHSSASLGSLMLRFSPVRVSPLSLKQLDLRTEKEERCFSMHKNFSKGRLSKKLTQTWPVQNKGWRRFGEVNK